MNGGRRSLAVSRVCLPKGTIQGTFQIIENKKKGERIPWMQWFKSKKDNSKDENKLYMQYVDKALVNGSLSRICVFTILY
jgi:hypothetical protein